MRFLRVQKGVHFFSGLRFRQGSMDYQLQAGGVADVEKTYLEIQDPRYGVVQSFSHFIVSLDLMQRPPL